MIKRFAYPLIIFIISLLFFGYAIGDYPLIDLDEPRYPESAREMIEHGQYWLPMTNGKFLFEKPILIYWVQILSIKVFALNEFAVRLPSVIAASLTVMLAFLFGRFFRIGLYTAVILATSIEFFVIARLSIADMLLNLFVISSIALYFLISQNLIHKNYFYLFALLVSFGFLAKGPLAIFVPGLVIFSYSLIQALMNVQSLKDKTNILKKNFKMMLICFIIFLIFGLSWFIVAHCITDGGFSKQFFLTENLRRFTSTLSGHKFAWWFYLAVAFVGFLPWSAFLPTYLLGLKENIFANKETLQLKIFSLAWILSNIIFFSLSGTKLYNYIFSVFFPLAVLTALYFYEAKSKDLIISSIIILLAALSLLSLKLTGFYDALVSKVAFLNEFIRDDFIYTLIAAVFIFAILGFILHRKENRKLYFTLVSVVFASLLLFAVHKAIIPYAQYKVAGIKNFASMMPAGVKLYRLKIDRPSLTFYTKTYSKSISKKKLLKKLALNEQLCILAKKDNLEFFKTQEKLKILAEDELYLYVCTK